MSDAKAAEDSWDQERAAMQTAKHEQNEAREALFTKAELIVYLAAYSRAPDGPPPP